MSAPRGKVLVLGKEDRAFLAVIRSLGRRGLEVHIAWTPSEALARHSRYVRATHEIPAYSPTDDAWKDAFVALFRRERFDLVIPTNDSTIIPLQENRRDLEPHARIYLLDDHVFRVAFDKEKTYDLAQSLGVRLPRQLRLVAPFDPQVVLREFRLPVVLKPRSSFRLDDIHQKSFVRKVFSPADLERSLAPFARDGEVWVQEYFEGSGVGVEGIADHGRVLLAFQHVRIHERRKGGADSYREAVALHPELADAFTRMMRGLDYTGAGMLEFKLNFTTGQWVLLELNARFWASLPVAIAAGADFPWYLYQQLVEGRREFPQAYRTGVFCRNWGRDAVWWKENLTAPARERVPVTRLLAELGPALRGREYSDTFALDDLRPGLEDLRRLAGRALTRAGRELRGALGRTPPVRRRSARRARRALRDAHLVLFVCKGNICRSPFAARYLQTVVSNGTQVLSAGYYPKAGRPCPSEALDAAREAGIDLAPHRSAILDDALVARADTIFVFDRQNWQLVRQRWPMARTKLHFVGDLARGGQREIRDPYGEGVDVFRSTYRYIRTSIDAALQDTGTT
jgi:protein-tyrosine-phosphatase/predicted ATP-grasp superfamily ATP-dependent carboligase